jgi:ribosomal protein S19
MSRSSWKKPVIMNENLKRSRSKKRLKITKRNFIISPYYLNRKVCIYNGKVFVNVFIDKKKIGYKFGEFVYSRKICEHKVKKNKSNMPKGKKK